MPRALVSEAFLTPPACTPIVLTKVPPIAKSEAISFVIFGVDEFIRNFLNRPSNMGMSGDRSNMAIETIMSDEIFLAIIRQGQMIRIHDPDDPAAGKPAQPDAHRFQHRLLGRPVSKKQKVILSSAQFPFGVIGKHAMQPRHAWLDFFDVQANGEIGRNPGDIFCFVG
jgi:hypothetical protein